MLQYGAHRVVVRADDEQVLERVRHSFSEMLGGGSPLSQEVLTVRRVAETHELLRGEAVVFADPKRSRVQTKLRHQIIRSFIVAHPDLLWLHGGVAVRDGRALLFIGRFGRGKSTLVTQLCERGWKYASDDIAPTDLSTSCVLPFPLTPMVRQEIGVELPAERISELRRVKISLPEATFYREPAAIAGLVLPAYQTGVGAVLRPHSPAAVALEVVREGINRESHGQAFVALCARLVDEGPVITLNFSDPTAAADLIERELSNHATWQGAFEPAIQPPPERLAVA